jgi:hypothetical protein
MVTTDVDAHEQLLKLMREVVWVRRGKKLNMVAAAFDSAAIILRGFF